MKTVSRVRAVAGRGLEGDRYYLDAEKETSKREPGREVTLVETEAIGALDRDYGLRIEPKDSRRNIATRGVVLNDLVHREFWVGEVLLRGVRPADPCRDLASRVGEGLLEGLRNRGGLRAQIRKGGMIRVGDPIRTKVMQRMRREGRDLDASK